MGLTAGRSEKPTDRTSKQETKGERGRDEGERGREERVQNRRQRQRVCRLVCVYVQPVEAMYVFLSDPRINAGTARREEKGLSVGWDGIKGTSVESEGQG